MTPWLLSFAISAGACSVNVAMYVANPNAVSVGAAVFCGALAVFNLVMAANS